MLTQSIKGSVVDERCYGFSEYEDSVVKHWGCDLKVSNSLCDLEVELS